MNDDTRAGLVMTAIGQVIDNDADGAATSLMTLGQNSDGNQMYGVCCALAEAAKHLLPKIFGPQPDDAFWVLEELKPNSLNGPKAFSVRFITAYANGDTDTTKALFSAAMHASDDEYVDSITALLIDVGGFARLALDLKDNPPA